MIITILGIIKALAEIAGLALLGQGVLYLLAGANREQNIFYRVLATITRPVWKATRWLAPRVILDQHIGFLSFLLLVLVWYFALLGQAARCLGELGHPSCEPLLLEYVKRCESGETDACELLRRSGVTPPPGR